ncbi:uncharacterized protein BDR25DRAFT_361685 [Lindgomyces ingoldianus]|uniref:Uncharacterized protein n=1 Tax=Lindgomyces ingoldianus TaxID=673940 RepID=A0ACB6QD32_9PLEO|nr:uncharacterized protein BDR25DRAFT_361685 [Lindgomyces ingoldianus]KAF2464410.1 hypothetical protein BDR25DRAFT_361685 [Lindgomyces ingoldianus]
MQESGTPLAEANCLRSQTNRPIKKSAFFVSQSGRYGVITSCCPVSGKIHTNSKELNHPRVHISYERRSLIGPKARLSTSIQRMLIPTCKPEGSTMGNQLGPSVSSYKIKYIAPQTLSLPYIIRECEMNEHQIQLIDSYLRVFQPPEESHNVSYVHNVAHVTVTTTGWARGTCRDSNPTEEEWTDAGGVTCYK